MTRAEQEAVDRRELEAARSREQASARMRRREEIRWLVASLAEGATP